MRGTVTAVTPIKPGADLDLLEEALYSVLDSLAGPFQWRYACAPQELSEVQALAEDLQLDADGFTTTSPNVAATRNRLARMGTGEYLLQMDADDIYAPGGLAQMALALDTHRGCVAAHGRTVDVAADGSTVIFEPPSWWLDFPDNVADPGALADRREHIGSTGAPPCYPMVPAAGLFRREAVLAVGGWDEGCGNFFEDTVLAAKLSTRPWYLCHGVHVLWWRRNQVNGSLSSRELTGAQWEIYDRIAAAHEDGLPHLAPPPAFPTPKETR